MNSDYRHIYALILLSVTVAIFFLSMTSREIVHYEGVEGPPGKAVIAAATPTPWSDYEFSGTSGLGILLTDPDSAWLGLAHGLKSAGIPFSITTDYKRALQHKVILIYPRVSGALLSPQALRALGSVPRRGGTLIGSFVIGGGLNEVFGFTRAVPSRERFRLIMAAPANAGEIDPREAWLPLGHTDRKGEAIGTYAYLNPRGKPAASYEDGSAAITYRPVADGHAYALGVDFGAMLLKGYNYREEGHARSYANEYEPTLDVLLRFIGKVLRQGEPDTVFLRPVPEGKDLAVILTHDIDFTRSLPNAVAYASFEQSAGVRGSYFIQTKYVSDWNDAPILDLRGPAILQQLRELGVELASHGVSHSLLFANFPLGDGDERYPDYRPFVRDAEITRDGTILGELRVSRYLVETLSGAPPVTSFRPGYLSNPKALPQALMATGYLYSSSVSANKSLTHLPFQLNHNRDVSTEVPIFEFPITIEDELGAPLGDRLPQAVALARNIARHGGLFVVLIHPDILGHKLKFERELVTAVRDFSWFGSLSDFGQWWAARNEVLVDSLWRQDHLLVRLSAPRPISGLTLDVPAGLRLDPQLTNPSGARQAGRRLNLGRIEGEVEIRLFKYTQD